jgi:hypothetical protein
MRAKSALTGALSQIIYFLPKLVSAAIILAVGLLLAWGCAVVVRRVSHAVGIDKFFAKHGVMTRAANQQRVSYGCGRITYWVIALVTAVAALEALDISSVTAGLERVVAYLPNVFAAGLICLVGYLGGQAVYRTAERRGTSGQVWPKAARGAIFTLAGFMAIQELHVAVGIISILFAFVVGAMAIAFAISFGMGNRELAGRVTREWWERNRPTRVRDTSTTAGIPTREPMMPGTELHTELHDDQSPPDPRH